MKPLLIVDGYNVIGAWPEAEREQWPLDECRDRLLRSLEDYAGYADEEIVLVFDGYQSDRKIRTEETLESHVTVVYTKHAETADSYIERLVAQTPKYRSVRVATSDGLEQSQILSTGAIRLTSRELLRELRQARSQGITHGTPRTAAAGNRIGSQLPDHIFDELERLRRSDGKK